MFFQRKNLSLTNSVMVEPKLKKKRYRIHVIFIHVISEITHEDWRLKMNAIFIAMTTLQWSARTSICIDLFRIDLYIDIYILYTFSLINCFVIYEYALEIIIKILGAVTSNTNTPPILQHAFNDKQPKKKKEISKEQRTRNQQRNIANDR